jgi:hypothetical protein
MYAEADTSLESPMEPRRVGSLILLIVILIVLGHSVLSLSQGRFRQGMIMFPVLAIIYVFGHAARSRDRRELELFNQQQDDRTESDPSPSQSEDTDEPRENKH